MRIPGVANIQAVVVRPEIRHIGECTPGAQHIGGGSLALALRMDPVLDPNQVRAVPIARDITGGEVAGHRGLQVGVDEDAVLHGQSGCGGELRARRDTGADDQQVRSDPSAVSQCECLAIEALGLRAKVKRHAMLLMQAGDETAHFPTQRTFQRHLVGGHHMHLEPARPQRCRRLHADETGADQGHRRRALARLDNRPGIGQRAQHEHLGQLEPRNCQPPRDRTRSDEQDVVSQSFA
ncbi:hypothetical protein D9M68_725060 [compost metagenome]